jgi:hypothetical protein
MVKTLDDVKRVHEIADHLRELGIPEKTVDRIHQWANGEKKRLRDEAREHAHSNQNQAGSVNG